MNGEQRGLTISAYKSTWRADLVAAYFLKQTEELFKDFIYHGIYRDDKFVIMEGIKTKKGMNVWVEKFENEMNRLAESDCLQFTAEIGISKKTKE